MLKARAGAIAIVAIGLTVATVWRGQWFFVLLGACLTLGALGTAIFGERKIRLDAENLESWRRSYPDIDLDSDIAVLKSLRTHFKCGLKEAKRLAKAIRQL